MRRGEVKMHERIIEATVPGDYLYIRFLGIDNSGLETGHLFVSCGSLSFLGGIKFKDRGCEYISPEQCVCMCLDEQDDTREAVGA